MEGIHGHRAFLQEVQTKQLPDLLLYMETDQSRETAETRFKSFNILGFLENDNAEGEVSGNCNHKRENSIGYFR